MSYDVESYWSRVAREIAQRDDANVVAGDDDPYFRYKRARFLERLLGTLDLGGRTVLEVGCGPGGNLVELARRCRPGRLIGVDISQPMLDLAAKSLARGGAAAELRKVDGTRPPFEDASIDTTLTVTVLQHNTDGAALRALVAEIGRVTRERVEVIEDIGREGLEGSGSFLARTVDTYRGLFESQGFVLEHRRFLDTRASYLAWRAITGALVPRSHREGEPIAGLPRLLVSAALPVTRRLDDVLPGERGLARLSFRRLAPAAG